MEWNEEILKDIERIAAAGYTPRGTAFRIGVAAERFLEILQNQEHPVTLAYYSGLNSSELAVIESVMQLARSGSGPAQTLALKIFDETRKNLKREGLDEE